MDTDSHSSADAEVVDQIVSGDVNAFEVLLHRYEAHVVRIVKKHIPFDKVEEVAQDVFIRVYQSLPNFKRDDSFKQWLSTITIRTCYDFWRKHYRYREIPVSSLSEKHQIWLEEATAAKSSQSFDERYSQKEAREVLDWALDRLSPEDRMVLELVYLEGYSVKEAASLLGWSTVNVKVRSFRARKKLHKLIKEIF
ncbi:MAG: RNA polymerase sigma factor [Deltaproteobacteria bacterium]|nr:RNA polymerase sigma factor [Deltaproteobacteria bacterium]